MRYLIISLITIQIMIGRQSQRNFIISLPSIEKYQSTRVSGVLNYTIPRVVHNTRENFASIMMDSSYNGYSYLSNVTNPIFGVSMIMNR